MRSGIFVGLLCSTSALCAQDLESGANLFTRHCATCHGIEATGKGPMASVLLVQPTDLTALSANNDGAFPRARVVMRIDGRDPLVSHGSQMPVFGWYFEGETAVLATNAGQPIMTTKPVADLVSWLESVQD